MNELQLHKTYNIDGEKAIVFKQNNENFPFRVEINKYKMDFYAEPSKGMIEEKYITIVADEMIEAREQEIENNINNINNADKKIKDLLDLGFTKERALMSVALTNQKVDFKGISHEGQKEYEDNEAEIEY